MKVGRRPSLDEEQQALARDMALVGRHPYSKVALFFGVSESTIARIVGVRHGLIGARPRRKVCAVCGRDEKTVKVNRFSLHSSLYGQRFSSRGAGAIDLCEPCWIAKGKIHMRRKIRRDAGLTRGPRVPDDPPPP